MQTVSVRRTNSESHARFCKLVLSSAAALSSLASLGCQATPARRVAMSDVPPNMHSAASNTAHASKMTRAQSVAATPIRQASVSGNGARQTLTDTAASSYIAQASFQSPANGSKNSLPATPVSHDVSLQRLPMMHDYANIPVATGANIGKGAHAAGCSCCTSNYGAYQPVYSSQDLAMTSCGAIEQSGYMPPNYADPQEYIYDGGDQAPLVRIRDDYSLVGLGPEDTVVQFTTEDGREFAETGCRAAIYAPRFASVRRITSFRESDGVLAARSALLEQPAVQVNAPLPPTIVADNSKLRRESKVDVIEGFRERNRGVPILANQTPRGWSGAYKPYEDLNVIRTGVWAEKDEVLFMTGSNAAKSWTNKEELAVIIDDQAAELVETKEQPHELLTYELGGARIRMCKVASQQSADVGDTVDFTIRFDNIAEQTLSDLVIHDSLPPRLEYVPDSQQSSIEARFEAVPNEVGSETLRWKLDRSIEPGEGGIIRFQAKVR